MHTLEISYATDIGGRSTNEDKILARCFNGMYLLAVADGIGSHAAGEVASNVALTEIEKSLRLNPGEEDITEPLKEAVARANREIHSLSREKYEYNGMGTTLVMALIRQDKVFIASVGDSRAYCINGSQIKQITRDHSAVRELLDGGVINEEEASDHPYRGMLTRVLGVAPEVEADLYDVVLNPGDTLLLCSGGLTDSLKDEEIGEVINTADNLDEACAGLIRRAKESGARDNISIILAREKQG